MTTEINTFDLINLSDLGQKDRIQILLNEYNTLRAEIINRTGYGFQLTAIGFAVITWLLKDLPKDSEWYFWAGVLGLTVVFSLGTYVNVRDLTRAAHRVKNLEHEINSRAGERLLVWETSSGALTREEGFISSLTSVVEPIAFGELPPLDSSYLKNEQIRKQKNSKVNPE